MKLNRTGPKPESDLTGHRGIEEVRRVQYLMLLCSLLPPDGKLAEVLKLALSLHEEPFLARTKPVTDLHPQTTKNWMESIWLRDEMPADEEELIAWQNDVPSMNSAIAELTNVERQLGIRLSAEKVE
jgi:Family of unknown function (DUF5950)